jgi:hypothetical protein
LIPSNFIPGPVSGYDFTVALNATNTDFTVTANPASSNEGRYGYYVTADGTVRYSLLSSLAPGGAIGTPVSQ